MNVGDRYNLVEFGHKRLFKVVSPEEAAKALGDVFVQKYLQMDNFVFVYDENKQMTRAFSKSLLKQMGTLIR